MSKFSNFWKKILSFFIEVANGMKDKDITESIPSQNMVDVFSFESEYKLSPFWKKDQEEEQQ